MDIIIIIFFFFCRSELLSFIKKLRVSFTKIVMIVIAGFVEMWPKNTECFKLWLLR